MTPRNDDLFDTSEGDGMDDGLAAFVVELHRLGQGAVPEPSVELAALLVRPQLGRGRRLAPARTVLAAIAASAAIALGGAASQHALPEPVQSVVSHVVDRLTPFGLSTIEHPGRPLSPHGSTHHVGAPASPIVVRPPRPVRAVPSNRPAGPANRPAFPGPARLSGPHRPAPPRPHGFVHLRTHRSWPHRHLSHGHLSRGHLSRGHLSHGHRSPGHLSHGQLSHGHRPPAPTSRRLGHHGGPHHRHHRQHGGRQPLRPRQS